MRYEDESIKIVEKYPTEDGHAKLYAIIDLVHNRGEIGSIDLVAMPEDCIIDLKDDNAWTLDCLSNIVDFSRKVAAVHRLDREVNSPKGANNSAHSD